MGGEKVRNMTWGNKWKDLFLNELLSFHIILYSFHIGKYEDFSQKAVSVKATVYS